MTELAVQFRQVEKSYRHFQLKDIHFDLPKGQMMGLIGQNGAGKSTTIRILMGLIHQDAGEVTVLGKKMPKQQALAKRDIGFLSEDMHLYKQATLAWHIGFIQRIYPSWDEKYANYLLRKFNLKPEQKLKGFSHGQRVKASLLLILARRPKLLVLDEPTTGLDPVAKHDVLREMMDALLEEDRTILFSSHHTLDVEQHSDQIIFIDDGRILEQDDKESFLEKWRRFQLVVPSGVQLPNLPDTIATNAQGKLRTLVTSQFSEDMVQQFQNLGATVQSVDRMNLEEIFIAQVHKSREEVYA